jgi:Flp pilus assembly protein TadD
MAEKRVFLSHSSSDSTIVKIIGQELKKVGVWVDFWDLDVGDLIPNTIAEAIHGSKWFLLIASKSSVKSKWVKYEINTAIIKWIQDNEYKIVVARIDDCEIPKELSPFLYINTPRKPSTAIEQIVRLVSSNKTIEGKEIKSSRKNIVDRFSEIGAIETSVHEGKTYIVLWGLYGIGKTTIVERACAEIFNMGLIRLPLTQGHGLLRIALELCAQAGKQLPSPAANQQELYSASIEAIDMISNLGKIVLFDDLETALDEDGKLNQYISELIDKYYQSGSKKNPIFICSTQRPNLSLEQHKYSQIIKIDQLSDRDLLFCLENWMKLADPKGKKYERKQLEAIVPHLFGYPLGAKLASYLLVTHSPEFVLKDLQYFNKLRIDLTRQLLGRIRSGLDELQVKCLEALSVVDEGATLSELTQVLDSDIDLIRNAIDKCSQSLLIFVEDGLLQTHPLIKDYFWSRIYETGIWKTLADNYARHAQTRLGEKNLKEPELVRLCAFAYRMLTLCGKNDEANELAYKFKDQLREACQRLYYAKEYEMSLKYANSWLLINHKDNDIRLTKVRCLTRLQRYEEAEKELNELKKSGYKEYRLYHAWGILKRDQDDLVTASAMFVKGLAFRNDYLPLLRDYGDLQEKVGDLNGALDTLSKGYELSPRDAYITPKYADLLIKKNKWKEALVVIEGAITAYPEESSFEHRVSMIYDQMGRSDLAYIHAKRAVDDLNSDMLEAILHLATLEIRFNNNPEKAQEYLKKVRPNISKKAKRVRDTILADIKLRTNDIDGAKKILSQYSPLDDSYVAHLLFQIDLRESADLLAKKKMDALKIRIQAIHEKLTLALQKFPSHPVLVSDLQTLKNFESQIK